MSCFGGCNSLIFSQVKRFKSMEEYLMKSYTHEGTQFKVMAIEGNVVTIKFAENNQYQFITDVDLKQIATEEVPESCDLNEGCDSCGS